MKHTLALLGLALSCLLAGCGGSPSALSLRPLYKADEKPVAEPRLEGEWVPVALSSSGVHQEKNEHWRVTAQDDGCYQGERRKKDPEKTDQEENEFYRVCLMSLDGKLFFDQQLEKQNVGRVMISPKDLAPDVVTLHMAGRLWPQQDLIRLTRLSGSWIKENQPEELQMNHGGVVLFTGSTAQLRDIMTRHGEDPKAAGPAWYLCRPNADCRLRVVEDELAREPDDRDILAGAATFYAEIEDYDKMIVLANKAAERASPDDASFARDFVGFARLLKRDFAGARSEFAAARKQESQAENQAVDDAFIGISYFLEGKYAEAHSAFAKPKALPDSSPAVTIILDYATLVRMGRRKQAESFLADHMARFVGDADEQLLLLRATGRVKDFSPASFTDDELTGGEAALYALVRLAKGDRETAREALERTVKNAAKWSPAYAGAKIELERMGTN